jgi:hypothetical protein
MMSFKITFRYHDPKGEFVLSIDMSTILSLLLLTRN